jgi:hypothetical protein
MDTNNTKSMEQLDASIEAARMKLHALRVKNKRQCLIDMETRQKLSSHMESLTARMSKLLKEEPQRRSALQPYIFAVRQVMAGHSPQYVQTLQAKLCQSLHFLGISDTQVQKIRSYSKREAKFGKAESVTLSDESTSLTLDLVNQISHQDDHNHTLRNAYLEVMKLQSGIIRTLDLQTQPSIGFIRIDCSRRSSFKSGRGVFIKSGDLQQIEASMEFSTADGDTDAMSDSSSNNSLYISPTPYPSFPSRI